MSRRRPSKSRRRCRNCGRALTIAAFERGEWRAYDELENTLAGPQEREVYEHVVPCEVRSMLALRKAVKLQRKAERRAQRKAAA